MCECFPIDGYFSYITSQLISKAVCGGLYYYPISPMRKQGLERRLNVPCRKLSEAECGLLRFQALHLTTTLTTCLQSSKADIAQVSEPDAEDFA